MEEKNEYLKEDEDLLRAIDAIGGPTTGMAEEMAMHRLAVLQIKAMLRNRKTANDLDNSTAKYSFALIAFALCQLALSIFQFLFDAEFSEHPAVGVVYVVTVTGLIAYVLGSALKVIRKR